MTSIAHIESGIQASFKMLGWRSPAEEAAMRKSIHVHVTLRCVLSNVCHVNL